MVKDTFVEVYAGTSWQAGLVLSLLEHAGITAFLKDDFLGTLTPWYAAPGGAGAVKVLVPAEFGEDALPIIREFEETQKDGEKED